MNDNETKIEYKDLTKFEETITRNVRLALEKDFAMNAEIQNEARRFAVLDALDRSPIRHLLAPTLSGITTTVGNVVADVASTVDRFTSWLEKRVPKAFYAAVAELQAPDEFLTRKARDWTVSFDSVKGAKGEHKVVMVNPQVLFRGERLMATDTSTNPGHGTRIRSIFVGAKTQMPSNGTGILTAFFANNALGNEIKFDTCDKALSMSIAVEFLEDCVFDCSIFGRAVL